MSLASYGGAYSVCTQSQIHRLYGSSIWRPLHYFSIIWLALCASHSQYRVWRHYYDIHRNGVRTPVIRITGKEVAPSISVENPSNPSTPFNGLLFRELATMNGRTIRGYLSKWELALLLCAVISTGARLVCNLVRPESAWKRNKLCSNSVSPDYAIAYFDVGSS